jgi:hypothetical protein
LPQLLQQRAVLSVIPPDRHAFLYAFKVGFVEVEGREADTIELANGGLTQE